MKKSDLISGKHIVETRLGDRFLVAGDYLPNIYGDSFTELTSYEEDLNRIDSFTGFYEHDICKVYEIVYRTSLPRLFEDSETVKLIWERKPELSEAERVILENVEKHYKYIVRDESGEMEISEGLPIKKRDYWFANDSANFPFCNLFKMIKWEDSKPTLISDLLCEAEPFCWPK